MTDAPVPPELTFRFPGGRLSIDLIATLGRRGRRRPLERLRSSEDLSRWFVEAGLSPDPVPATARDVRGARALREALHRLVTAGLNGRAVDPADLAVLNRWAARPPPAVRLALAAGGRPVAVTDAGSPASLLAVVARDAVDLLAGPLRDRIRECEAAPCTVLFVDTSRSGRRRWCSMEICGARSKMAAYRRRQAAQGDPGTA
jgi:predicted RNA-binding Zn ribbon-like protein